MNQKVDTLDVPAHLLRAAYLLGKIPFRASRSDTRISYSLYIPEQYGRVHTRLQSQRDENADIRTPNSIPTSRARKLPLIVNIHGTRRDATTCRDSLIPLADNLGVAILAPLFPAGLDGPLDLDSYKTLRSETLKADVVLLAILEEVAEIWPGIEKEKVVLMGFSGGAQFVQRMLYVWPRRISAAIVAAPGRTTVLGGLEAWPHGTRDFGEIFGFHCEKDNIETLSGIGRNIGLFVGESDDEKAQEKNMSLQKWLDRRDSRVLRSSEEAKRVVEHKGRLSELRDLQRDWNRYEIDSTLQVIPGVAHNYQGLLAAMTDWLFNCPAFVNSN